MPSIDELVTKPFISPKPLPDHVPPELVRDLRWATGDVANELDDPYAQTLRLQQADVPPVLWSPFGTGGSREGCWVVTRYADIAQVYQDAAVFSTQHVAGFQYVVGETWPVIPLAIDPPDHMKYRMLLNPFFSPKAVDTLEKNIRGTANRLIDRFIADGKVDFAHEFSRVYPVMIFLDLMGLPFSMFEQFLVWEFDILHGGDMPKMTQAVTEILAYLRGFIKETEAGLGTNLTASIVQGKIDGRELTDDEKIGTVFFLWLGGLDTVAATLSLMFRRLALNPDLRSALVDNPALIPEAVEEFLRVQPLVNSGRQLKVDFEMHGIKMKKDDWIMCLTSAGNFDPAEFKNPRDIQLDRQPNRHFTLAGGPHRCLGSHLARRELRVALEEWLQRIPEFMIAEGADRRVNPGLIGARHLPLVW